MAVVTGKTSMSAPSAVLIARSINRLDTGSVNSNGSAVRIVPVGALKHSLVAPHFARRVAWKEASRGWEISRISCNEGRIIISLSRVSITR